MRCSANGSMRSRYRAWSPARLRCFWVSGGGKCEETETKRKSLRRRSGGLVQERLAAREAWCRELGTRSAQRFDFLAFFFFLAVFLTAFLGDFFAEDFLAAFLAFLAFLAFFGIIFLAAFLTAFLAFFTAGLGISFGASTTLVASVIGSIAGFKSSIWSPRV